MYERNTSTDLVVAGIMWAVVALMYVAAIGLAVHGELHASLILANIACGTSAYAAVRHLKRYFVRMCSKLDQESLERDVAHLTGVPPQRVR